MATAVRLKELTRHILWHWPHGNLYCGQLALLGTPKPFTQPAVVMVVKNIRYDHMVTSSQWLLIGGAYLCPVDRIWPFFHFGDQKEFGILFQVRGGGWTKSNLNSWQDCQNKKSQSLIAVSGPTEHCSIFHFPSVRPPFVSSSVTGVTYQLFSIFWRFIPWKPYIFWMHII